MREIYETREEYEMAMRSGIGNNYILPMESNEEVKVLQEKLEISVKECQHLKELLKECKEHLCHHYCQITVGKLEKKIEEVLK